MSFRNFQKLLPFLLLFITCAGVAMGQGAYSQPPPDLGADYVFPQSSQADPRAGWLAYVDTAALVIALVMAALIALRWRSRRAMVYLSIASVLYFGFYRKGCVCPVGSTQNIAQALFDSTYVVPWVVLAFFTLPLIFSLLFGRVFCAGVCPLGAVQDLVLLKPIRVSRGLDQGLSIFRYFYLGLAVMLAATGSTYFICKYDPFISFFRMSARFDIWIWSAGIILVSLFIARPYCRYLCPYSVLLSFLARFSLVRVTITPGKCVTCGLCRESCPVGAINEGEREFKKKIKPISSSEKCK